MARTNPLQFIQQVRAETAKVVWPTRRETGLTTVMVMIMATLFATFFFLVDLLIRFGLETILQHRLLNPRARAGVGGRALGRTAARVDSVARRFRCAGQAQGKKTAGGAHRPKIEVTDRRWRCAGIR